MTQNHQNPQQTSPRARQPSITKSLCSRGTQSLLAQGLLWWGLLTCRAAVLDSSRSWIGFGCRALAGLKGTAPRGQFHPRGQDARWLLQAFALEAADILRSTQTFAAMEADLRCSRICALQVDRFWKSTNKLSLRKPRDLSILQGGRVISSLVALGQRLGQCLVTSNERESSFHSKAPSKSHMCPQCIGQLQSEACCIRY